MFLFFLLEMEMDLFTAAFLKGHIKSDLDGNRARPMRDK